MILCPLGPLFFKAWSWVKPKLCCSWIMDGFFPQLVPLQLQLSRTRQEYWFCFPPNSLAQILKWRIVWQSWISQQSVYSLLSDPVLVHVSRWERYCLFSPVIQNFSTISSSCFAPRIWRSLKDKFECSWETPKPWMPCLLMRGGWTDSEWCPGKVPQRPTVDKSNRDMTCLGIDWEERPVSETSLALRVPRPR